MLIQPYSEPVSEDILYVCVFCSGLLYGVASTEPPCVFQLVFILRQWMISILNVSLLLDLGRRCYEDNGWGILGGKDP